MSLLTFSGAILGSGEPAWVHTFHSLRLFPQTYSDFFQSKQIKPHLFPLLLGLSPFLSPLLDPESPRDKLTHPLSFLLHKQQPSYWTISLKLFFQTYSQFPSFNPRDFSDLAWQKFFFFGSILSQLIALSFISNCFLCPFFIGAWTY